MKASRALLSRVLVATNILLLAIVFLFVASGCKPIEFGTTTPRADQPPATSAPESCDRLRTALREILLTNRTGSSGDLGDEALIGALQGFAKDALSGTTASPPTPVPTSRPACTPCQQPAPTRCPSCPICVPPTAPSPPLEDSVQALSSMDNARRCESSMNRCDVVDGAAEINSSNRCSSASVTACATNLDYIDENGTKLVIPGYPGPFSATSSFCLFSAHRALALTLRLSPGDSLQLYSSLDMVFAATSKVGASVARSLWKDQGNGEWIVPVPPLCSSGVVFPMLRLELATNGSSLGLDSTHCGLSNPKSASKGTKSGFLACPSTQTSFARSRVLINYERLDEGEDRDPIFVDTGIVSVSILSYDEDGEERVFGGDTWVVRLIGPSLHASLLHDSGMGFYEWTVEIHDPGLYDVELTLLHVDNTGLNLPPDEYIHRLDPAASFGRTIVGGFHVNGTALVPSPDIVCLEPNAPARWLLADEGSASTSRVMLGNHFYKWSPYDCRHNAFNRNSLSHVDAQERAFVYSLGDSHAQKLSGYLKTVGYIQPKFQGDWSPRELGVVFESEKLVLESTFVEHQLRTYMMWSDGWLSVDVFLADHCIKKTAPMTTYLSMGTWSARSGMSVEQFRRMLVWLVARIEDAVAKFEGEGPSPKILFSTIPPWPYDKGKNRDYRSLPRHFVLNQVIEEVVSSSPHVAAASVVYQACIAFWDHPVDSHHYLSSSMDEPTCGSAYANAIISSAAASAGVLLS